MQEPTRLRKELGQHLLVDPTYCRRIVNFSPLASGANVVEIGPGAGHLTEYLLETAGRVVAIEIDPVMVRALERKFPAALARKQLRIVHQDVLTFDWDSLPHLFQGSAPRRTREEPTRSIHLVANLPYNIATRTLTKMTESDSRFQSLTFMAQKEVTERILAEPGSKDYGYLTLLLQFHYHRESGFDVPPGAFRPPPKVVSHVMRLIPREPERTIPSYDDFLRLIQTAFRHRRKTLRNNLKPIFPDIRTLDRALRKTGVDPRRRPEEVAIDEYLSMSSMLSLRDE